MKTKKEEKQKAKRLKKLRSTMEWMDIDTLDHDGIYLKKDNKKMVVKGIRIMPVNIYLLSDAEKKARILRLSSAIDKLYQTQLYFKFIKSEPDVTLQASNYLQLLSTEENPAVSKIIELQVNKLEWFRETHREVKFFILVQDDELHIDKTFDMLKREFISAFGSRDLIRNMTYTDYKSIIQQEFEHEYIDELLFTEAVLPNALPNEVDEIYKRIGDEGNEFVEK